MRLIERAYNNLKKEGFWRTAGRSGSYLKRSFDKFLFVSLPLTIEKRRSCDGWTIKNVQGSKMILNIGDEGISRELMLTGVHEKNSTEELRKILKPGMTVVEVGANIGYYTLIESQLIGPGGYIYAFEPSQINMQNLRANIALNGIENKIETLQVGVGNKSGREPFYITNKGNTSSFINREDQSGIRTSTVAEVEVIRLDDFFNSPGKRKIDYVRMDVEGYELEVIDGMSGLFGENKGPGLMFIEIHSELLHRRNSSAKQFLSHLSSYGYEVSKSFFRGRADISANSTKELLGHPWLEKGYWETFFKK